MAISQREARALKKRVGELEGQLRQQRQYWAKDFPSGVWVGRVEYPNPSLTCEAAWVARKLGHAVVAIPNGERNMIELYALPLPELAP